MGTVIDRLEQVFSKDKSIENPRATALRHALYGSGDWHLEELCHLEDEQLIRLERIMKRSYP